MSDLAFWFRIYVMIITLAQRHENIFTSRNLTRLIDKYLIQSYSSGLVLTRLYRIQRNVNSDTIWQPTKKRSEMERQRLQQSLYIEVKRNPCVYMSCPSEANRDKCLGFFLLWKSRYLNAYKLRLKWDTERKKLPPTLGAGDMEPSVKTLILPEEFQCLD